MQEHRHARNISSILPNIIFSHVSFYTSFVFVLEHQAPCICIKEHLADFLQMDSKTLASHFFRTRVISVQSALLTIKAELKVILVKYRTAVRVAGYFRIPAVRESITFKYIYIFLFLQETGLNMLMKCGFGEDKKNEVYLSLLK